LRRFESDPHLRAQAQRAQAFVEGFEAADPALASVRSIADELRSGVDATSSRPVGSYAPLFAHLAARCAHAGVDVRLNAAVERIAWQHGDVTVGVRNAPDLHARCAIVTLPVGVLRQPPAAAPLTFAPRLPPEKRAALDGLEMGHAVRVTLAFRTPFWETLADGRYRDAAFFRCEGGAYNAFWTQWPLRDRTITAWAGGPRALALDGVPANARIERARDEFGAMFAQPERARREFEGGVTHDWSADPFACGAYSYVATGGGDARNRLATPLDETLFFAGEATATGGQGGTVSGAFETGMRAAHEVAQALNVGAAS
jgi:monoamine oxidase